MLRTSSWAQAPPAFASSKGPVAVCVEAAPRNAKLLKERLGLVWEMLFVRFGDVIGLVLWEILLSSWLGDVAFSCLGDLLFLHFARGSQSFRELRAAHVEYLVGLTL